MDDYIRIDDDLLGKNGIKLRELYLDRLTYKMITKRLVILQLENKGNYDQYEYVIDLKHFKIIAIIFNQNLFGISYPC